MNIYTIIMSLFVCGSIFYRNEIAGAHGMDTYIMK